MRSELGNAEFDYVIACTEICGKSHFGMKLKLVVDDEASYLKWKSSQKTMLAENPDLMSKVPDNMKAKAMKYLPQTEAAPAEIAAVGGGVGSTSKVLK
jgi:cytochrome c oxidase subunit II